MSAGRASAGATVPTPCSCRQQPLTPLLPAIPSSARRAPSQNPGPGTAPRHATRPTASAPDPGLGLSAPFLPCHGHPGLSYPQGLGQRLCPATWALGNSSFTRPRQLDPGLQPTSLEDGKSKPAWGAQQTRGIGRGTVLDLGVPRTLLGHERFRSVQQPYPLRRALRIPAAQTLRCRTLWITAAKPQACEGPGLRPTLAQIPSPMGFHSLPTALGFPLPQFSS